MVTIHFRPASRHRNFLRRLTAMHLPQCTRRTADLQVDCISGTSQRTCAIIGRSRNVAGPPGSQSTHRCRFRFLLLFPLLLLPLAASGCSSEHPDPQSQLNSVSTTADAVAESTRIPVPDTWRTVSDHDQVLGSQACRDCHSEQSEQWQSHPMSHSMAAADQIPFDLSVDVADFTDAVIPGSTRNYEVSLQNGSMTHIDVMRDASAAPIYSQRMQMDYSVGSGRRALAYLRREGELLFQSPLNWYSQQQCWDLAPGYRVDDPRRFRRRITDDCLSCHAGRPVTSELGPGRYPDPVFHELTIGCERCHGPGKAHVEFQRASVADQNGDSDPIVRLSALTASQRESLCLQCHLTGEARILRHGQTEFDFRPGMHLSDVWSVLDHPLNSAQSTDGLVTHAAQLRGSHCFQQSNGQLSCLSCHDPHRVPAENERIDFFRQRCLQCHQSDDHCSAAAASRNAEQNSCIACHMPPAGNNTAAHVSQTDHRILRFPAAPSAGSPLDNLQLAQFPDAGEPLPDWEHQRALGIGLFAVLMKQGKASPPQLAELLQPALQQHEDDGVALATLAALSLQHGRTTSARQLFTRAAKDPQAHESALAGLLDITYNEGSWQQSLDLADTLLRLDPGHPGYHAIRADCLQQLGRVDDAVKAAETALRLDPSRMEILSWLVQICRVNHMDQRADQLESILRRMQQATSE